MVFDLPGLPSTCDITHHNGNLTLLTPCQLPQEIASLIKGLLTIIVLLIIPYTYNSINIAIYYKIHKHLPTNSAKKPMYLVHIVLAASSSFSLQVATKVRASSTWVQATVDGRNPAPVDMVNIPIIYMVLYIREYRWLTGFLPSTVWMDVQFLWLQKPAPLNSQQNSKNKINKPRQNCSKSPGRKVGNF